MRHKEGSNDTWQHQLSGSQAGELAIPQSATRILQSPTHGAVKWQIHLRVTEVITGAVCTLRVKNVARETIEKFVSAIH
jgi:hypothetical protein